MNKPISEKISEFRKARSLTQEKLGEQLGVSSQAVSKWEKGESMPDIMILPQLCEILGITADALLEVPTSVKKDSCMSGLAVYAKEVGEYKAAFEAIRACADISGDYKGSAQMSDDGLRISNTKGYGIVISGEEMLKAIQNTDYESIGRLCEILSDENIIKVIRAICFTEFRSEDDIIKLSGLERETVRLALFKLLKLNFCECDINEKFIFGAQSYALLAVLSGMYLASPDGHKDICSIGRNYMYKSSDN